MHTTRHIVATIGRFLFVSKVALVVVLAVIVIPLSAFEARVVNVTATIERPPCELYEIRSMGFWKTHSELWILSQTLGTTTVATPDEATAVFVLPNNIARNKLMKQLLALKFNGAYFGFGDALVPGELTLINDLVGEADSMLAALPPPTDAEFNAMKDRVESANVAEVVSTCFTELTAQESVSASAGLGDAAEDFLNAAENGGEPEDNAATKDDATTTPDELVASASTTVETKGDEEPVVPDGGGNAAPEEEIQEESMPAPPGEDTAAETPTELEETTGASEIGGGEEEPSQEIPENEPPPSP